MIANAADIKRNAVTAADDPVDRTVTHYGVPQTDSATRSQSSMTTETANSTVSAHNNGNQLQIVTGTNNSCNGIGIRSILMGKYFNLRNWITEDWHATKTGYFYTL